jgi:saccharopine dehydrogenase-like NADP-dependent oxidoreductase
MKAIVHIDGGVVQQVLVDNDKMDVIVIDRDIEGCENVKSYIFDGGERVECRVVDIAEINKEHVDTIYKQVCS